MPIGVEHRPLATERVQSERRPSQKAFVIGAAILLACVLAVAIVFTRKWPFTEQSITAALQQQAGGAVAIGHFRPIYFPHPGCVAEQIAFRRGPGSSPPYIVIQRLTILGSYHGLLTQDISTIRADGLHISIPPEPAGNGNQSPMSRINVGSLRPGLSVGQIIADGAEVEFPATDPREKPLVYRIPKLALHDLADGRPLAYQAIVELPEPPAEVDLTGKFGPWRAGQGGQSHMSGSYQVKRLDLGAFSGIGGLLSSKGDFDGILQHVKVKGSIDAPNFEVRTSRHTVHLAADFDALVNGLNGDVELDATRIQLARSIIDSAGTIAGEGNEPGKTARIQLASSRARIQDLLWLFVSDDKPPMTGSIVLRAKATLPPGDRPFLDKLRLEGDFGISSAQYPHPETQKDVDVLSARARGQADKVEDIDDKRGNDSYDPGRVLSNVKGHVLLTQGVAKLSDVKFDVPGAAVQVSGTYNLRNERIDLHGQMWMDTQLSKATTGVKSFLLKIVQPLTRDKQHKGSVVSVTIGGTYRNPTYTVLPTAKK